MRMIPEWMDVVCSTSNAAATSSVPSFSHRTSMRGMASTHELLRKRLEAPVRQDAMTAGTASIVRGDPHRVSQCVAEVAQPALHLRVRPLTLAFLVDALALALAEFTDAIQIGSPRGERVGVSCRRRRRVPSLSDIEEEP